MILSFLVACNDEPGSTKAPEPVPFSVDITLPDGSVEAAETVEVRVLHLAGDDCLDSSWIQSVNDPTEELGADAQLAWASSGVVLDESFGSLAWDPDQYRGLMGGTSTVVEATDTALDIRFEGGRECSRTDQDSEETCVENEGIASVRIEGDFAAQGFTEKEGRAGFGDDVATGDPVCGLWDPPAAE